MSSHQIVLLSIAVASVFSALSLWARQSGGRRRLWLTWAVCTLAFVILNVANWHRMPVKETPLAAYILVAVVPTLAAATFIDWTRASDQPLIIQFLGAVAICWVLMPGMLLIGLYGIGA